MNYIKQYLKELLMGKKENETHEWNDKRNGRQDYRASEKYAHKCKPCGCANYTNPPHKDICESACCNCCS